MNKLLTTSGLLMALALLLAVNIISNASLKSARLDLTENKLYTLSEGTKNILSSLEEPITLRFYLSKKLATNRPGISSYTIQVEELLEEYQRLAGDNINLRIIDPEPFSEEEDRAEGYGLQGVPIDESNTTFYFGLAGTNSVDDEEVINFFSPARAEFLEYDVTKLIYQLAHPKQKVVGLMSTLPIQGGGSPFAPDAAKPWMIMEHIQQLFEIRPLETTAEAIPEDIDILMLVHPKGLSDATLYAIDQFVLTGGRAIVFVDPYSEAEKPPVDEKNPFAAWQAPRNSEFTRLLNAWGIDLLTDKAVGDLQVAQKVQMRRGAKALVVNYPVWMNLNDKAYFNQEDIATGQLNNVVMATPGSLEKKGDVGTEIIPLIQTSEQAMKIDTKKLGFLGDPESLVRDFKGEGQFTLAARITGKIKTAFPDGKPEKAEAEDGEKAEETEEADSAQLTESKAPVNLIVVADTDLLQDQFWVQVQNFLGQRIAMPHAHNAAFVTNTLENLSGSNDLISVRSRGSFARPFTRVEAIQQEAEKQFREKEKELLDRLQVADQKIRDLQSQKKEGNAVMLSLEQQQEINRFRDEKIKVRKELRDVQHRLRKDIEHLEWWMKFINIGLIPLLIGFGGVTLSFYQNHRKRGLQPVNG